MKGVYYMENYKIKEYLIDTYYRNLLFGLDSEYQGYIYDVSDKMLRIKKYVGDICNELFIPDVFDVLGSFFYGSSINLESVKKINLNKITILEDSSLFGCNLEEIIADNLVDIGNEAFSLCLNLSKVKAPNVKKVHSSAFKNCANLSSIQMESVKILESFAFSECTNLMYVDMPKLYFIGDWAFAGCENLIKLPLSSGLILGEASFRWCKKLFSHVA